MCFLYLAVLEGSCLGGREGGERRQWVWDGVLFAGQMATQAVRHWVLQDLQKTRARTPLVFYNSNPGRGSKSPPPPPTLPPSLERKRCHRRNACGSQPGRNVSPALACCGLECGPLFVFCFLIAHLRPRPRRARIGSSALYEATTRVLAAPAGAALAVRVRRVRLRTFVRHCLRPVGGAGDSRH